jgi:hypothetical protein
VGITTIKTLVSGDNHYKNVVSGDNHYKNVVRGGNHNINVHSSNDQHRDKNLHSGRNHFINVYSGVVHSAGVANVVCAAHPNLALEHVKIDLMHANIGSDAIAVTIIM